MATDVLDLYAKVKFDSSEFNSGLSQAEKSFSDFGGKIKAGVETVAKITAGAVAAGAAAVGKIVSDSVSAYGSYEQLVGGVQTLFGDSAAKVIENSEQAFRTAGMSMNEYMETSIQSAAALINSLGGDQAQAADLMDMSIRDMSDNVNKMGTTMEAVQNAYRGFSRGNFTMLDNLALGFSGTKEGMEELLEKAEQISGIHYDISSYSDIVKAIHEVQQAMGITGTTAAEAADTIQGSAGSMKAAWENLKVELVKEDGDIGKSIDILFNSALTVFDNIEPKIERALGGVSEFVAKAAPVIAEKLPPIIEKIIPPLISASSTLVYSVGKGIAQALPSLLGSMGNLASGAYSKFAQADLGAFDWIREDIVHVVSTVSETLGRLDLSGLFGNIKEFGGSLNGLWSEIGDGFTWLVDNVFSPLAEWGMNDILPSVFTALSGAADILKGALEFLETPAKAVWQEFLQPLAENSGILIAEGLNLVAGAIKLIGETIEGVDWEGWWIDLFSGEFGTNWQLGWKDICDNIDELGEEIDEFFDTSDFANSWNEFWQGVGEAIYDFQKDKLEPAHIFFTTVFVPAFNSGFNSIKATVIEDIIEMVGKITELIEKITEVKDKITDGFNTANAYVTTVNAIKDSFVGRFLSGNGAGQHRAAGGIIISQPVYDRRGNLYGEAGREALLPLDSNTGWMDQLAERLNRGGGGVVVQNLNLSIEGGRIADDYDTERLVEKIAEKLGALNIRQERAVGGIGWT